MRLEAGIWYLTREQKLRQRWRCSTYYVVQVREALVRHRYNLATACPKKYVELAWSFSYPDPLTLRVEQRQLICTKQIATLQDSYRRTANLWSAGRTLCLVRDRTNGRCKFMKTLARVAETLSARSGEMVLTRDKNNWGNNDVTHPRCV